MKPHPSCYDRAILKKLVVFMKSVELFSFSWDAGRLKNIFCVCEALLELAGSCGIQGTVYEF